MNDLDIEQYLLSYAPLDKFYLFSPPESIDVLIMFFDDTGSVWSIMEDDESIVADAVAFLERLNKKVFQTHPDLLAYEREVRGSKTVSA